jgi:ABC-type dipeptide/oligopeptide/nickel transport system ATPase subunit
MMSGKRQPLLEVRRLCKTYVQGRWWQRHFEVRAIDCVNLTIDAGKTLALLGESGSGKTTLAMCLVGLEKADAGDILLDGKNLTDLRNSDPFQACGAIQMIFQDSTGALNPGMSAMELIGEPLLIRGKENRKTRRERVLEVMDQVGLPASWQNRKPHELSGGQRQRLAIARALTLSPKLLILDEALAGLDLSIQGQISNLLLDLQSANDLSYLYISHNLALVAQFADDVVILERGKVTKKCAAAQLLAQSELATPVVSPILKEKAIGMSASGGCA